VAGPSTTPGPLEQALAAHAAIAECVVLEGTAGSSTAVVVLETGMHLSSQELARHLKELLGDAPRRFYFHEGPLPRDASGQVSVEQLRHGLEH
jgi:acyl-coenzyme A synthetase/AMP-(fatty) acid ligase